MIQNPTQEELTPKLRSFVSTQVHGASIEMVKLTNGLFIMVIFMENQRSYEIAANIRAWLQKHYTGVALRQAEVSDNKRSCNYHCSSFPIAAKKFVR